MVGGKKQNKKKSGSRPGVPQIPGELFKTEHAEAMPTLRLERLPQNFFALLALIFGLHGHRQDQPIYSW